MNPMEERQQQAVVSTAAALPSNATFQTRAYFFADIPACSTSHPQAPPWLVASYLPPGSGSQGRSVLVSQDQEHVHQTLGPPRPDGNIRQTYTDYEWPQLLSSDRAPKDIKPGRQSGIYHIFIYNASVRIL